MDAARETLAVARAACKADDGGLLLEEADPTIDVAEAGRLAELAPVATEEAEGRPERPSSPWPQARADLGNARDRREEAERLLAEEAGGDDPDGARPVAIADR